MRTRRQVQAHAATTLLALLVVVLGAYVRLTSAGLGCPDWPGCYGTLTVPRGEAATTEANAAFPDRPVEAGKAWREMAHRYAAGALGLAILALAVAAWRRPDPRIGRAAPSLLLALVLVQAALGMWTVTLLLKPAVVTAHLLGGMATLALLAWTTLRASGLRAAVGAPPGLTKAAMVGVAIVIAQICLGGWTSTNYAALACPELPTCQGQWFPTDDAASAFRLWHGVGRDYEGGILSNEARMVIHASHRFGAILTLCYVALVTLLVRARAVEPLLRTAANLVLALLVAQFMIGLGNIVFALPLSLAVAHNAGAALLLVAMVAFVQLLGSAPHRP